MIVYLIYCRGREWLSNGGKNFFDWRKTVGKGGKYR
jgi:hypothetical protein